MYSYENGLKRKNVGYARVETRNRQCKFTLHVQMAGQPDSIVPTYLVFRNNEDIGVVYLGDSILRNQLVDNKLIAKEADIIEAGKGLGKACGIILFINSHQFCATYWDDEKVNVNDVLEALNPKKKPPNEINREMVEKSETEPKEEQEGKVLEDSTTEQDLKRVVDDSEALAIETLVESTEDESEETFVESTEDESEETFVESTEDEINEFSEEVTGNQLEREDNQYREGLDNVEEKVPEKSVGRILETPVEKATNKDMESLQHHDELSLYKLPGGYKFTQAVQRENRGKIQATRQSDDKYFIPFTKINPFEDKTVVMCVKMEPKDIGVLPKEVWSFSNNSFLLHGYYSYKYIIFAKLMDQRGPHYILGVPGVFNNKEKFVAKMFGFNNFKSAKKQTLRQGDFGYWYTVVKI